MDPVPVDRPVPPRPKLPKAFGVLNVVFGLPLFLCGLTCLRPVAPTLSQLEVFRFEPELFQHVYEQQRETLLETLKTREQSAKNESEKLAIRQQRMAFETNKNPRIADQVDQKVVNHGLERITWYLWADVVTGAILNLLMLASGIGLIQLHEWARRMALWVAGLKIVRIVALAVFFVLVVVPAASKTMQALLATDFGKVVFAQQQADQMPTKPGAPPTQVVDPKSLAPWYPVVGNTLTLLFATAGLIYPAISLVALSRPSAKAACEEAFTEGSNDSSDFSF